MTATVNSTEQEVALKSTQFRREREKSWEELERLLDDNRMAAQPGDAVGPHPGIPQPG